MAPCMFLGIRCRMSRMKKKNRVGDSTLPCWTPCLRVLFLLKCCFIWTFAFLLCIYCPVHLYILPATPHWCGFNFRPSFHILSNAFSRSIHSKCVFLVLEGIFNCLGDIGDLVLSRPILPKSCLLWCDVLFVFKMPHESCVDKTLHQFSHANGEADWSVAFSLRLVLASLEYRDHDGFSPDLWHCSHSPSIIEQLQ